MSRIDQAIEQANQGLNRIKIVKQGRKLALRDSLPKRPAEGRGSAIQIILGPLDFDGGNHPAL